MSSPIHNDRASLYSQILTQQEEPTIDDGHLLHYLCQAFPTDKEVIQTALVLDSVKKDVCRPASLPLIRGKDTCVGIHLKNFKVGLSFSRKRLDGSMSKHKLRKLKPTTPLSAKAKGQINKPKHKFDFQYPINIAINNGASTDVIHLLANAAPEILFQPEDIRNTNSLLIALQKQPKNDSLVKLLLQYAPQLAAIKDHHGNTPLHWAVQRGPCCPLSIIKSLFFANPKAVLEANFHGETPLMLAQRKLLVPEDVVSFLCDTTTENICSQLEAKEMANRKVTLTDDCLLSSVAGGTHCDNEPR